LRVGLGRSTLGVAVTTNRVILLALAGVAAAIAAAVGLLQGSIAIEHLALDALPFLLVAGLLVTGRFVGEEHRIAQLRARRPARPRPERRSWPLERDLPLAGLLERSPRTLRGPPGLVAVAA
jgi:hypothetical protein